MNDIELVIHTNYGGFHFDDEMALWLQENRGWKIIDKKNYVYDGEYDLKTLIDYHHGHLSSPHNMSSVELREHKDLIDCVRELQKKHENDEWRVKYYSYLSNLKIVNVQLLVEIEEYEASSIFRPEQMEKRMFLVIEVFMDYDHVEGVKYLDEFVDRETAEKFITALKSIENEKQKKNFDYINQYVDNFVLPDKFRYDRHDTCDEWKEYLNTNFTISYFCTPSSFKKDLLYSLCQGNGVKSKDLNFNQPPRGRWRNLHITERP